MIVKGHLKEFELWQPENGIGRAMLTIKTSSKTTDVWNVYLRSVDLVYIFMISTDDNDGFVEISLGRRYPKIINKNPQVSERAMNFINYELSQKNNQQHSDS